MSAIDGYDFRLNEVSRIRKYFEDEIKDRKKIRKKIKTLLNVSESVTVVLNVLVITTGGVTIAATTSVIGAQIALLSSLGLGASVLSGGVTLIIKRKLTIKHSKHIKILVLAETLYANICVAVSRALKDQKIDEQEYEAIVNEKQKYLSLKANLQKKTIQNDVVLKKQIEEILLKMNLK